MIHAREDYNRIKDPSGKIAEDEPVFIVRAKDINAPATMRAWADFHVKSGGCHKMAGIVMAHADLAEEWQEKNGCRVADL